MKLTSELQVLLNKAVPLKPELAAQKQNRRPPKPSQQLMTLLTRMDNRTWREEMLKSTLEYIRASAGELFLIRHLRSCEECRVIAQLDIERYLGSRSVWFLNIENDVAMGEDAYADDEFKGCPYAGNYRIGSYWTGSSQDTFRFIDDRMNWAEGFIRKKMLLACRYYKRMKAWDLNGQEPCEPELTNSLYQPQPLT